MKRIVAESWTWSSSSNPSTWHNSWTTRQPWDPHRGRQLNSVGPSATNDVPDARLTLGIRSNVDLGASLSLSAAQPMEVAEQIRDQAVSQGGFVEQWNESRRDERQHVSMELVVKAI